MAAINLTGLIEDGGAGASVSSPTIMASRIGLLESDPGKSTGIVVFGPTLMSQRTGVVTRRLADTGTGSGVAVSKESWS